MRKKKINRTLATIDLETDPFQHGRLPKPFLSGFDDGERVVEFWGDDCILRLVEFLATLKDPHIIYAHNGGKFDFFYFFDYIENPIRIINGRIVEATIGKHIFRDSYAILPVPLKTHGKKEIEFWKFEKEVREEHKDEIIEYWKYDCRSLYDLVFKFRERFGDKLTIGSTAITTLKKIHPFITASESHDAQFRQFYFGGRVEALETGILHGKFEVYDVNSMYPDAMKNAIHPTGRAYACVSSPKLVGDCMLKGFKCPFFFIRVIGKNHGALPMRLKDGLNFRVPYGEFFTTSHELRVALRHGLFEIEKIVSAFVPSNTIQFGEYVDTFMEEKIVGKKTGNKTMELFAKLLLNSAYGKFAQSPDKYYDYEIVRDLSEIATREDFDKWEFYEKHAEFSIWRTKSQTKAYYDVAIAASITSASRANLLGALASATRPVYCDTDSIICEQFGGRVDEHALGAWKHEATLTRIAIAGKKLYAGFNEAGEVEKLATKGVRLSAEEIVRVCTGGDVHWQNAAPSFSISSPPKFISRTIKSRV
jgi:DNA polymerase elongation subunit (family B)